MVVTFLDDEQGELDSLLRTYAIVSLLSLVAITAVAAWQSGRLLAPLRSLNDTAREISATDLSRRLPETGNDDITALTRTFNEMLDRLEARVHRPARSSSTTPATSCRTPLTVLAGHLELLDVRDPDEVAATRALLARRGRPDVAAGRRPDPAGQGRPARASSRPHPVDLDRARPAPCWPRPAALGDRDWEVDGAGVVTVAGSTSSGSPRRCSQLAENAVKHTGPGDVVAIGSGVRPGTRCGCGCATPAPASPTEDRTRIFERFARARRRARRRRLRARAVHRRAPSPRPTAAARASTDAVAPAPGS